MSRLDPNDDYSDVWIAVALLVIGVCLIIVGASIQ